MFQQYATDAGSKIWILDLMPDSSNSVEPNGRRWRPGDPVPIRVLMDYETGATACTRNPLRYRAELMPDLDYAELLKGTPQ